MKPPVKSARKSEKRERKRRNSWRSSLKSGNPEIFDRKTGAQKRYLALVIDNLGDAQPTCKARSPWISVYLLGIRVTVKLKETTRNQKLRVKLKSLKENIKIRLSKVLQDRNRAGVDKMEVITQMKIQKHNTKKA